MRFFKVVTNLTPTERVIAAGFQLPDGTIFAAGKGQAGVILSTTEDFEKDMERLSILKISVRWFE